MKADRMDRPRFRSAVPLPGNPGEDRFVEEVLHVEKSWFATGRFGDQASLVNSFYR